jgi:phosphoglycolate phosphatase
MMRSTQTKLIIFDWDGTLCDSVATIAACIQLAAKDCQLEPPSRAEAASIIGLGLPEAIQQLFPGLQSDAVHHFASMYSSHFRQQELNPSNLFDGVLETLNWLRDDGKLLAVATGKSKAGLERALARLDLVDFFHGSRTADQTLSKPNPLMLNQLLEEFAVSPNQAIMVGDTTFDLEMAQRAGVPSIGLTYGAHPKRRLQPFQPIVCLDNFPEIKNYIK